jgi:serine protease Do
MSFHTDDPASHALPRGSNPGPLRLLLLMGCTAGAVVLLLTVAIPFIRNEWMNGDPEHRANGRMMEARVEAEAAFRKREAELKAEANAAGEKLEKIEFAPSAFREVAARTGPAVVNISNLVRNQFGFGRRQLDIEYVPQGEGSGVLVRIDDDKRGYILTNSHVVRGAERLGITFQSERTITATLDAVHNDVQTDLAVIRFDASDLPHLTVAEFADSDKTGVGDWVVAIGSPFGLKQTVTVGIVSAKGRQNALGSRDGVLSEVELIQTDAAINPGNSGGPLLDLKGRIVGINTAIISRTGGYQGIGLAIPSNTAQAIFEQLVRPPHRVVRGFMGVGGFVELTQRDAARLNVPGGVLVQSVPARNPAARAGLKPGDIIVKFANKDITSINQLRRLIMEGRPGSTVQIDVLRMEDNAINRMTLSVVLAEKPPPEPDDR